MYRGTQLSISATEGKETNHYAAGVCSTSTLCTGDHAACSLTKSYQYNYTLGEINNVRWSEEYPEGISIIYGNGTGCDNEDTEFIITFQCDPTTENRIHTFTPSCLSNRIILQTKYACENSYSSTSTSNEIIQIGLNPSVISGLIIITILSYCAFVYLILFARNKKNNNNIIQDTKVMDV